MKRKSECRVSHKSLCSLTQPAEWERDCRKKARKSKVLAKRKLSTAMCESHHWWCVIYSMTTQHWPQEIKSFDQILSAEASQDIHLEQHVEVTTRSNQERESENEHENRSWS